MDQHQLTRLWTARRASSNLARRSFVALVVVVLVVAALADPDGPHDVSWFATAALGVTAELLWAVVVVATGFVFLVANPRAYAPGRDRPLPTLGRWARLVNRVSVRAFWFGLLAVPLAVFGFKAIGESALLWREVHVDAAIERVQAAAAIAFVVAFAAVLVWLGCEMVAGFREGRARRREDTHPETSYEMRP